MIIHRLCISITLSLFTISSMHAQTLALQRSYISVVVDASLSMNQPLGTETKISVLQEALSTFFTKVDNYPELTASLGTFGSSRTSTNPDQCTDYKFLVPFDIGNTSRLNSALRRITHFGTSPVANAMRTAVKALPADNAKKYVIIFTDGGDSCMELVCDDFAQQDSLTNGIFIVGIGIPVEDQELFSCTSTFANADNADELAAALQRIFDVIKPY